MLTIPEFGETINNVGVNISFVFVTLVIVFIFIIFGVMSGSIFSTYQPGESKFSPALFWEYDKDNFIPSEHKELVVRRVVERGRLNDYFAAFDVCGGIEEFKQIYLNLRNPDKFSKNFLRISLGL